LIVQIPDDISAYEPKLFGNFTVRQVVCAVISFIVVAAVFIPLFLLTGDVTSAGFAACMIGVPIIFFSVIKKDGLHFEHILLLKLQDAKYAKHRPFRMRNYYEDFAILNNEIKEIEETYDLDSK